MTLKTCNSNLELHACLQPLECNALYETMKHVVWIVKVVLRNVTNARYATGFCVHKDGFILTSGFRVEEAQKIFVRSLKDTKSSKYIRAERIDSDVNGVGAALLKVDQECDYAALGGDFGLTPGRVVFGISHQDCFYFSLLTGRLVSLPKGKSEVEIVIEGLESFIEELRPDLQFLHISGFQSRSETVPVMQSLGAPVFDSRGNVIGMIVAVDRGFDYALPVAFLVEFLRGEHVHVGI